ncbi:MAG: hypothetical protein ACI9DG_001345 [Oleispira sp.]|jgi:hypothetical protein
MPTGNESSAFPNECVPGEFTGGGVAEAVLDYPLDADIVRCSYVEILQHGSCL